jgi:hypothetical protein
VSASWEILARSNVLRERFWKPVSSSAFTSYPLGTWSGCLKTLMLGCRASSACFVCFRGKALVYFLNDGCPHAHLRIHCLAVISQSLHVLVRTGGI